MTIEQLRRVHHASPFQPYTLHLADGRELHVRHRDFLATAPSGRTVIVYQSDDAFNIVDLFLVTDLEIRAPSNGRGKKGKKG